MRYLILFFLSGLACFGQENYPTSTPTHIFWQPDTKITAKDYEGKSNPQNDELIKE